MGGGLASKSLQFTAEWSEIEGSMTSIFDTNYFYTQCISIGGLISKIFNLNWSNYISLKSLCFAESRYS